MEGINKAIAATGIVAVIFGIAMAYVERHVDDVNLAFVPLLCGFVAVFAFFFLIVKRDDDRYGKIKE